MKVLCFALTPPPKKNLNETNTDYMTGFENEPLDSDHTVARNMYIKYIHIYIYMPINNKNND